jgi:hypothetical protein
VQCRHQRSSHSVQQQQHVCVQGLIQQQKQQQSRTAGYACNALPSLTSLSNCYAYTSCKRSARLHSHTWFDLSLAFTHSLLRLSCSPSLPAGNGDSEGTFRFANYWGEVAEINAAKQHLQQHEGQTVIGLLGECSRMGAVQCSQVQWSASPAVLHSAVSAVQYSAGGHWAAG